MARIKTAAGLKISGKLGNLVFVQQGEQTYVRTSPERKKGHWSRRQQQHRSRFQAFTAYYQQMREKVVKPIWNLSATKQFTGYNLFMKANMPAFNQQGELADPSLLHFSTGPLPLPLCLSAEKNDSAPQLVNIRWEPGAVSPLASGNDELLMIINTASGTEGPITTGTFRKEGHYQLDLSEHQEEQEGNLYLFFANSERSAYSEDKYIHIE